MKYKTIIELICDAADKEDAFHIAGEYLRGEVESGVEMKCKAITLRTQRMLISGVVSVLVLFFFSSFAGMIVREKNDDLKKISNMLLSNTCTIQPVLKTKHTYVDYYIYPLPLVGEV